MQKNWTVLLIGGSSGIGKSNVSKTLSLIYKTQLIGADDVCQSLKDKSRKEEYPAIHYWMGDEDWQKVTVFENVNYLCRVSHELSDCLKMIVNDSLDRDIPLIIEGDFISPEFAATFSSSRVKSVFLYETDIRQIERNYKAREGGDIQSFRASISFEYGQKIKNKCTDHGLSHIQVRPWETLLDRIIENLRL